MADLSRSHKAINRDKLDAFVARCLEPVEMQISREDARAERSARNKAWHHAFITTEYFSALHRAATVTHTYNRHVDPAAAEIDTDKRFEFLQSYRDAVAERLLTPAVTQADIKWKQTTRKQPHLPVDQKEVDAAIAEDSAYMARRKLKGGRS